MAKKTPALRRHKRSGNAYARFDGRQLWFGPFEDPSSHEAFARTLAEWKANGCQLPVDGVQEGITVGDVVARYLEFAERCYCGPDSRPTREVANLCDAVRPLLALYGTLRASELGLRQLKTLREQLIDRSLARKTINDRLNRILRVFSWATEEEMVRPEVLHGLRALRPLQRGRSRAKEGQAVEPVAWEIVVETLPHLTEVAVR